MKLFHNLAFGIVSAMLVAGCTFEEDPVSRRHALEKDQQVIENMRKVQVAAERYAADHGGLSYPTAIDDDFKTYFPGGIEGQRPAPVGPVNPFTGENEFPLLGQVTNVEKTRNGQRLELKPGRIEYNSLAEGKSYAVIGGAHDGKALADQNNPGQVLVFSNE